MARRDETDSGITQRERVKGDVFATTRGGLVDGSGTALSLTAAQVASLQASIPNDGSAFALSESQPVQTITATGTVVTGACEFRGFVLRAISGTPQTVTIYDATSATGTPIMVSSITALGTYYWDGDWATAGNGRGGRRINSTGLHVVISGGTSRTMDVMAA